MWRIQVMVLPLLVLLVLPCIPGARGQDDVYIKEVKVPLFVRRGEEVELECRWKAPGGLYSLKWYFNDREIFRYKPDETPPMDVLRIPYVEVNRAKSTGEKMVLNNVQFHSSGKYKCEVIGEAPTFYTADKSANMTVVDVPEEKPRITGIKHQYHIGDEARLTCTSAKSFPPARLTWYINDHQAPERFIVPMNNTVYEQQLEAAHQGLRFIVSHEHFRNGEMTLKCTAEVRSVYVKSHQHSVDGQLTYNVPVMESRDISAMSGGALSGGGGGGQSLVMMVLTMVMVTVVALMVLANVPR